MIVLNVDWDIIYDYRNAGAFAFVTQDKSLLDLVTDKKNVCLKIFFNPIFENIEKYVWGRPFLSVGGDMTIPQKQYSYLLDTVKIQNICARYNLAPRIYEIIIINYRGERYPALLMDYIKPKETKDQPVIIEKIKELGRFYGFKSDYIDTGQPKNFIADKFVDFQGWEFEGYYEERLKQRYIENVTWADNTYQSLPQFDIKGYRDTRKRFELMGLDEIDFKGKTVLDVGCSGGAFSRYAWSRGAKKVVAVDLPKVSDTAFEVNNYLGYYGIDFIKADLTKKKLKIKPDIVFYLSVYRYFGKLDILDSAETIIYEHNGDIELEEVIKQFDKFSYKIIGDTGSTTGSNDNRKTVIFTKL